ncbi:MAG: 2-hydroxyacid dehydrogenase [Clostridiales bacterium]|nr:2-hydroxyacid dehydrogenase [Clostridiales bacterium]
MKILILTNESRVRRFYDLTTLPADFELVFAGTQPTDEDILSFGTDYDALFVDAIQPVSAAVIAAMPKLKLIHSEGVAYNSIDTQAAAAHGVAVCHCVAINDTAVAEQTILLILATLRRFREGETLLYAGKQIQAKTQFILDGLNELSSQRVGIIGLGAIGRQTARLLHAFGAEVCYYNRHQLPPEQEAELHVRYLPQAELLSTCDIVSLHCPVTPETTHLINNHTLALMKPTAILINTARGEIIDQEAVRAALIEGRLGALGADVLSPEPVPADNPLLTLPEEYKYKVTLTPHVGGVTVQTFQKGHRLVWDNMRALAEGKPLQYTVN